MMEAMAASSQLSSSSPSFNSYSSETLAEIAARVLEELRTTHPLSVSDDHDTLFDSWDSNDDVQGGGADDDEFEFALVCRDPNSSPVSADDIFYNGQIKPMYPIFDRSLVFTQPHFAPRHDVVSVPDASLSPSETAPVRRHRLPLRKLMFEERETGSCSSSASEVDDINLDAAAPETYCVWSPKSASAGRNERKKSKSTGSSSSKRWNLRHLLFLRSGSQSSSGRKDAVVFLNQNQSKRSSKVAQEVSKAAGAGGQEFPYYMRKGPTKERVETKKKSSLLPQRHEMIGIFSNVNGVGRNLHPF